MYLEATPLTHSGIVAENNKIYISFLALLLAFKSLTI